MLIIGLAIDFGRSISGQRDLQRAVDVAAIAAASVIGSTDQQRIEMANVYFDANIPQNSWVRPLGNSTLTPAITTSNGTVMITANAEIPTAFVRIARINSMTISASAASPIASTVGGGRACLLALEPTGRGAWLNGGNTGSAIDANCGVYVNSSASNAIFGNNKGTLNSTYTCIGPGGDYDNSVSYTPTPTLNCPIMADPFAYLAAPPSSGCDFNNTKARDGDRLRPGIYCGGLDISSNANVEFETGIYVIKDGQFKIGAHAEAASLAGGVMFYLTGNNARVLFTSHSKINFQALQSGPHRGMLIFQDRDLALSNDHEFGCKSDSILQGAVYSKSTGVQISSSGSVFASSDWTVWVVKNVQLSSSATLKILANYATSPTPLPPALSGTAMTYMPTRVRLTQ